MTELKGTVLASGIVPGTTEDKFPTHYAEYGKGGFRTVKSITERDNIPEERREEGMLVYVTNDDSKVHTYQYINGEWEKASLNSSGIPIYNQRKLDELGDSAEDEYIFIPSEEDLEGEIVNNTYTTQGNGSYLDIMFSAIRQLQTEVAKMRNAFRYGMVSYTGTETAMSTTINDIEEPEDEPLWALDPDMLSIIAGSEITIDGTTIPSNLKPTGSISLRENKITISDAGCSWEDLNDIVSSVEDNKIFLYITSGALKNSEGQYITMPEGHTNGRDIQIILKDITPEDEEEDTTSPVSLTDLDNNITPNTDLTIDINALSGNIPQQDKYNILVVISRNHPEKGGKNYVWISIGDTKDSKLEGYYDIISNSLKPSLIELPKYTFKEINLKSLDLYQLDFYSKGYDFSNSIEDVLPSAPSDEDYKYKVAHLTIRSVDNMEMMESIKLQLLNNELIFKEDDNTLWIKINNNLVSIAGSGSGSGDGGNNDNITMTTQQIIEELKKLGIVYGGEIDDFTGEYDLNIASISDITFIHQATGKKFKFGVSAEGELRSTEIPTETLAKRINNLKNTAFEINENSEIRGFVAKLHAGEAGRAGKGKTATQTKDLGLDSDRIKIGSIYMPKDTDTKFGCSHAFIELENTSDKDFPLEGCYLHFLHPIDLADNYRIDCLKLEGILPAGSTFLIRGKEYANPKTSANTYITVDDYDMEWYINGQLLDLTYKDNKSYALVLTYGQYNIETGESELNKDSALIIDNTNVETKDKAPKLYPWYFIDSVVIEKFHDDKKPWASSVAAQNFSNSIIKNTFELDPAKQAYQGLTEYDSSRYRFKNTTTDVQILNLDKEFIEFPHSDESYPISRYTPKASKYKKNVSTDKTVFNLEKPNAVSCSFGINVYTTRCFNWVSAGEFNEFVWLKENDTWKKFESYTTVTLGEGEDGSEIPTQSGDCPRKKEFSKNTINAVYARIINDFPGCKIHYTSHKCIIEFNEVDTPTEYTYVVGRADLTNNNIPDLSHCSEEFKFTLYPNTYKPRIFLTTDQQGFHWIEYQVWAAAANFLANKIDNTISEHNSNPTNTDKIFPILLNSGDMTQNGTRVNEWLDYFNGGHNLFNHLEHMAVIGNNDLGNPDVTILGTGDDSGKSNPYFFHVFTCYEIFEQLKIKNSDNTEETISISPIINDKYIPSLYYFDAGNRRFLMANSELTLTACEKIYGLAATGDQASNTYNRVYNIYTGFGVSNKTEDSWVHFNNNFTSIYTMIWSILNNAQINSKSTMAVCHEMPYTVITTECLNGNIANVINTSRSVNEKGSLVGCHMNQITPLDSKANYWFSRLCEYFKISLVLGGHKHTYAITHPVREYYLYKSSIDSNTYDRDSLTNGPMTMLRTLENDNVYWKKEVGGRSTDLSKFPILQNYIEKEDPENGYFYPFTNDTSNNYKDNFVTYLMCQATGYKQTSNKELPTNYQSFSKLIPKSNITIEDGVVVDSKADNQQKYPMYVDVDILTGKVYLKRISNIQKDYKFTQSNFSTTAMVEELAILSTNLVSITYLADTTSSGTVTINNEYKTKYCSWLDTTNITPLSSEDIETSDKLSKVLVENKAYKFNYSGQDIIIIYKKKEVSVSSGTTTFSFEQVIDINTIKLTNI